MHTIADTISQQQSRGSPLSRGTGRETGSPTKPGKRQEPADVPICGHPLPLAGYIPQSKRTHGFIWNMLGSRLPRGEDHRGSSRIPIRQVQVQVLCSVALVMTESVECHCLVLFPIAVLIRTSFHTAVYGARTECMYMTEFVCERDGDEILAERSRTSLSRLVAL